MIYALRCGLFTLLDWAGNVAFGGLVVAAVLGAVLLTGLVLLAVAAALAVGAVAAMVSLPLALLSAGLWALARAV